MASWKQGSASSWHRPGQNLVATLREALETLSTFLLVFHMFYQMVLLNATSTRVTTTTSRMMRIETCARRCVGSFATATATTPSVATRANVMIKRLVSTSRSAKMTASSRRSCLRMKSLLVVKHVKLATSFLMSCPEQKLLNTLDMVMLGMLRRRLFENVCVESSNVHQRIVKLGTKVGVLVPLTQQTNIPFFVARQVGHNQLGVDQQLGNKVSDANQQS